MRLDVGLLRALERVEGRDRGRHLSDDRDDNERVWTAFHEHVVPRCKVDLVIDTESASVDDVVQTIVGALPDRLRASLDRT